jgi:hypothetical protein
LVVPVRAEQIIDPVAPQQGILPLCNQLVCGSFDDGNVRPSIGA